MDPNRFWHVKKLAKLLRSWGYFVLQKGYVIVAIGDNVVYVLDFNMNKKVLNEPKKLSVYRVKYVEDDKFKSFIAKLVFERGGEVEYFPFGEFEIASEVSQQA